jgi:hypothetical protein
MVMPRALGLVRGNPAIGKVCAVRMRVKDSWG